MPTPFDQFVIDLQSNGRCCFTAAEAQQALHASPVAVQHAARRAKVRGVLAAPVRGFYVTVPPEYRRLGCRPAEQFVPELMAHVGEPYYAALLTAAAWHGAAHQAPMTFQVMVPRPRRSIRCGQVQVDFVVRSDMGATPTASRNTPAGVLRIASPAATALELVGYPERCGYLDNVATVLSELTESLRAEDLAAEARRSPVAWTQRLGYLLDRLGAHALAAVLHGVLGERRHYWIRLAPWKASAGGERDARWKAVVNTTVEVDE